MPDVPVYRKVKKIRHEWAIAVPCDAKNFEYGVHAIKQDMEKLGLLTHHDDAYHVRIDDEEIVFYIDTEKTND